MATSQSAQVKRVLLTGAEGALGSHVLKRFQEKGAEVIATYRKDPGADPSAHWVQVELAKPASVRDAVASAVQKKGGIDALVHCAGGFRWSQADQVQDADIEFLIDANLKSTLYLLREVLPGMKAQNFGRIVLVSAKATLAPASGMGTYAATKAGINALVAAVADEVKDYNININAVLPSIIDTPANRKDMPKADYSKWVSPDELAQVIHSLTDTVSKPVNGALVQVAGRL